MSKSVKSIELTFENIDYIVIPAHFFLDFMLEDVKVKICRAAVNAILRYNSTDKLMFVLKKEVNEVASNLEGDVHAIQCEGATLFERISIYNDLTHIKFVYEDESSEEYSITWEDEDNNEYRNGLQKATITEDGNLCVEIRRR